MTSTRCAIYTRKSSEEGLDQAFNSLDAQREACAAYILSQAGEGWVALPEVYDDGGLSGGTLDRPALQRLLSEVKAGRVDTIVVYKVDRLTRSLFDFAKLVEQFDKSGTSFVSVTQSFNTTTSMGRLTLNMLLSFAQFEREVTAERIRDKIAASKAKGMWMGGTPPIGYRPNGRTLDIVEKDAGLVRHVFERYLALGNVPRVEEELARDGYRSPARTDGKGRQFGNRMLSRGQLYVIIKNPLYIGLIEHKGQTYPALHDRIIDRETWDSVQAKLADNVQGRRSGANVKNASLLSGKVIGEDGEALIATHASRGATRYRYYISRGLQRAKGGGVRIPARELETLVTERVAGAFEDPVALAIDCGIELQPDDFHRLQERGRQASGSVGSRDRALVRMLVEQVRIASDGIAIECSTNVIAGQLGVSAPTRPSTTITLTSNARLTRSGRVVKLVHDNGCPVVPTPDPALVKLVAKAHRWWGELRTSGLDIKRFAAEQGINATYMSRVLRLAFLSPAVIDAILDGTIGAGTAASRIVGAGALPLSWAEQAKGMLGGHEIR